MSKKVVFYQLNSRFLHKGMDAPADAQQIVYYSLAIGHHVGVIDTFRPLLSCPYEGYLRWVAALPEGEGRRKLQGVERFGEITIDSTHVELLRPMLQAAVPMLDAEPAEWSRQLDAALQGIEQEPALYLMVRRC